MPTVPVGNKQLGELSSVAVIASKNSDGALRSLNLATYAVVQSNAPTQPVVVKNKFLGELSTVAAVKNNGASSVTAAVISMYAVVKLAPPTSITATNFTGLALIKSDVTQEIAAPQTKFINEFSTIAAITMSYSETASLVASTLSMYAVVKYVKPRKELTIFNIEYAADAEFNQTPPQGAN